MRVAGNTDSARILIMAGWLSYPPVMTVGTEVGRRSHGRSADLEERHGPLSRSACPYHPGSQLT